ncbi:hypothetical protein PoB_002680700 [Plakobranchus ocellatus]|uniref:Uncharacterized protein n=1 Tax=Plakobranchus ocellatus TaxID=259542 RepID=A0AAV4A049_9GAST|nr:hypothetical protein PoB_002680700 [Plakobranchus ocellatus]
MTTLLPLDALKPHRDIMINIEFPKKPDDDEDYGLGSGSGSGSTEEPPTVPFVPTNFTITKEGGGEGGDIGGEGGRGGGGYTTAGQTDLRNVNNGDDFPIYIIIASAVAAAVIILLIIIIVVCLVRRRRKATLAERSARWDRAAGVNLGSNHSTNAGPNHTARSLYIRGAQYETPTTSSPSVPPPPPPSYEQENPRIVSASSNFMDPTSPTPLLCYDSLGYDGHKVSDESLDLAQTNHYESIGV